MDELWLSIITGGFTIAGIMITNFYNLPLSKRRKIS